MRPLNEMMSWLGHEHAGHAAPAPPRSFQPPRPIGLPWRSIPSPRPSHAMIAVSRVLRARVYDKQRRAAGEIIDLSLDKSTGRVTFAIVSFGAFFGFRARLHPVPWPLLRYDTGIDAYVTPLSASEIDAAPTLSPDDLEAFGAGDRAWRERLAAYYNPLLQLGAL